MKSVLVCAVLVCVALTVPAFASQAPTAGFTAFTAPSSFTSPPDYQAGNPVNLGMVFTTSSNISVTELGFYADPAATAGETVTLYNGAGTALVSQVVSTANLSNGYYWVGVGANPLPTGTYTVSAFVGDNPWAYGAAPGTVSPIAFKYNDYLYSSSAAFPSITGGSGPAYYGPNFMYTVPEPSLLLMLGAGLASVMGMVGAARRKLI